MMKNMKRILIFTLVTMLLSTVPVSAATNKNTAKSSYSISKNKTKKNKKNSSKSYKHKSNENDLYDKGYESIENDEDYNEKLYNKNDSYAQGVDDAMEDFDW